jgi:hypothetical protein
VSRRLSRGVRKKLVSDIQLQVKGSNWKRTQCEQRRIPIPDFDSYLFQYREIPLILKAERLRARREQDVSDHENGGNGNTSEEEEADEPSEGGPGVAR